MVHYEFSNADYYRTHGKNPRGTGHWAFCIKNADLDIHVPETFHERVHEYRTDTIFWVPGVWTLAEAKKRARVILSANAVPPCVVCVAP